MSSSFLCHGGTSRQAHCDSQHSAQLITGAQSDLWEAKEKQTRKTRTADPGQKKSYLDLAGASALISLAYKVNLRESHGRLE